MMTFNFTTNVYTHHGWLLLILTGAHMPVILEAILVSAGMILIFALAFLAIFLLAITLSPIERSLSKMIWDATTPKNLPPHKGSFRDFSKKH